MAYPRRRHPDPPRAARPVGEANRQPSVFLMGKILWNAVRQQPSRRSTPMAANGWSKTWTFYEGDWHEGNIGIVGPRTHALWLASPVVDGARALQGGTPRLGPPCEAIKNSAR